MEENKPNKDLNPDASSPNAQPLEETPVKKTTPRKSGAKPIDAEIAVNPTPEELDSTSGELVAIEEGLEVIEPKPEKKPKRADKSKKKDKDKDKKKEKEKKAKKKKKEKAKKEKAKKKLKEKKAKKKASKKKKK